MSHSKECIHERDLSSVFRMEKNKVVVVQNAFKLEFSELHNFFFSMN